MFLLLTESWETSPSSPSHPIFLSTALPPLGRLLSSPCHVRGLDIWKNAEVSWWSPPPFVFYLLIPTIWTWSHANWLAIPCWDLLCFTAESSPILYHPPKKRFIFVYLGLFLFKCILFKFILYIIIFKLSIYLSLFYFSYNIYVKLEKLKCGMSLQKEFIYK